MKTLDQLNNIEKGYLLIDLFRPEIGGYLDYLQQLAGKVVADQQVIREGWQNGLLDFSEWLYLATEISDFLTRRKAEAAEKRAVFSEFLFSGYLILFTCHALEQYAKRPGCPPKLALAIHTFFHTGFHLPPLPKIL